MKNINIKGGTIFAAKVFVFMFLMVLVIISQTGCSNKEPVSKTDFCLNTTCDITVYNISRGDGEEILEEAFNKIREYENIFSRTVEGSDVYNINHAGGNPVEVSDDTVSVLEDAVYMGKLSGGKFDITIGKISDMWNFTGEEPKVPENADIKEALKDVDYTNIEIDGNRVTLKNPKANIDLGGIAKGYIADRISEFLEDKGVDKAIINLGGNVAALGEKDEDTPWNIGIERPYSDRTQIIGSVKASDATLVTSGIYERKFEQNGIVYHHILDPKTGYPADTDLESVTIKAVKGNSEFCDGLSTVCLMMGKDNAIALIKELQEKYPDMKLEAAFIDKNDDMVQTDGMNVEIIKE